MAHCNPAPPHPSPGISKGLCLDPVSGLVLLSIVMLFLLYLNFSS